MFCASRVSYAGSSGPATAGAAVPCASERRDEATSSRRVRMTCPTRDPREGNAVAPACTSDGSASNALEDEDRDLPDGQLLVLVVVRPHGVRALPPGGALLALDPAGDVLVPLGSVLEQHV